MTIKSGLIILFFSISSLSYGEVSRFRVSGLLGLANAQVTSLSTSPVTVEQGPLGGTAAMEYLFDGEWEFGSEHKRTWGGTKGSSAGSAVGLTGIVVKNYFWISHPQVKTSEGSLGSASLFEMNALIPYVGGVFGISQASIVEKNINNIGFYGALKVGVDWPMTKMWGLRGESSYSSTLDGSISLMALEFGAYFYL